jgi:hypothetical protein
MPQSPAYEIELVVCAAGENYHVAMLATLTGLPKAEVEAQLPAELRRANSWRGQSYVQVARLLRYNCNRQFIPFEARTPWPCILRVQDPAFKSGWWSLIYANGSVYDVWNEWVMYLDDFLRQHPEVIITSMLQIWMGDNHPLT